MAIIRTEEEANRSGRTEEVYSKKQAELYIAKQVRYTWKNFLEPLKTFTHFF